MKGLSGIPGVNKSDSPKFILITVFFAFFAILLTSIISFKLLGQQGGLYLVASMGAAATLVFAVPGSQMSQPWPLIGGHIWSASSGVACNMLISDPSFAVASAVGLAILGMILLKCLHPPGGATAISAVLGGSTVVDMGFSYVIAPVFLNAFILLILAILFNSLAPGRQYPSRGPHARAAKPNAEADLQDILDSLNTLEKGIDISPSQFQSLVSEVTLKRRKRNMGEVVCIEYIDDNWPTIYEYEAKEKAIVEFSQSGKEILVVLNRQNKLVGLLPLHLENYTHFSDVPDDAPVGQIMTTPVRTVDSKMHIVDAHIIFQNNAIDYLPVIERGHYLGMLTRTKVEEVMEK